MCSSSLSPACATALGLSWVDFLLFWVFLLHKRLAEERPFERKRPFMGDASRFEGCFRTHPTPSALSFPVHLGFSHAVLQAPSFPHSPGTLFFLFSLLPIFPSLFPPWKLSGEQRGQPLRWHSLLTSPRGQAQLPEVSGLESIPSWGQSPCELGRREPRGWDGAHELRRALAGVTPCPPRRSCPVPSPNECQGLAWPFPTAGRSVQLSLVSLDRARGLAQMP